MPITSSTTTTLTCDVCDDFRVYYEDNKPKEWFIVTMHYVSEREVRAKCELAFCPKCKGNLIDITRNKWRPE